MCNSSAMQSIKSSSVVKHLSSSINRNQSRGQGRENITNRSSFYSTMPCAIRERLAHFIHNTLSHWFSRERRTKKKKKRKELGASDEWTGKRLWLISIENLCCSKRVKSEPGKRTLMSTMMEWVAESPDPETCFQKYSEYQSMMNVPTSPKAYSRAARLRNWNSH